MQDENTDLGHVPVLLRESLELLEVEKSGLYVDTTVGLGGHSEAIARAMGPSGRLVCFDQDREALEFARARLTPIGRRVSFAHGNFREIAEVCAGRHRPQPRDKRGFARRPSVPRVDGRGHRVRDRLTRGAAAADLGAERRVDRTPLLGEP